MKLQRVTNRRRGSKEYHKWQVTLPPDEVEALGWRAGDELDAQRGTDSLTLRRRRAQRKS